MDKIKLTIRYKSGDYTDEIEIVDLYDHYFDVISKARYMMNHAIGFIDFTVEKVENASEEES